MPVCSWGELTSDGNKETIFLQSWEARGQSVLGVRWTLLLRLQTSAEPPVQVVWLSAAEPRHIFQLGTSGVCSHCTVLPSHH